ncbi:MAG: S41 family peptidase [Ignavibacteriales bacterium]|nr:S41 family peptidase [Ignavibacteriales bacterium]
MKLFLGSQRRGKIIVLSITISAFIFGFTMSDGDYFFKINKSIDVFGRVYKEIALNYVDEVDPEKFMESGIDGLLSTLDPYSTFISETEAEEVELITVGKYGGIGITVGSRDGYITVLSLMEGYSAQRQGIQPGDRIIEVDGKSIVGLKAEELRILTRGEPGSEVRLKIERDGEGKHLEFVLVREEIQLKNITYSDFIKDSIAYIKLERFSRGAGDELRLAIKDLQLKRPIGGVILDLRGNPGGLLDVAVDVVEKFLPKGSLVVSTRGRQPETERKFYATEDPMLQNVPLVVLVNNRSASASEIVAGAVQDLDRGIILGTRSFGKGLVQTIIPLVYNTQLKLTTAKYYTPSGRCIQEIDYTHRNKDGIFSPVPESTKKTFKTLKGRLELEAGGIQPDTVVNEPEQGEFYDFLIRKAMFFKFANLYVQTHQDTPKVFGTDELTAELKKYLDSIKFTFQDEVETKYLELCTKAEKNKYRPAVREQFEKLKSMLKEEKPDLVHQYADEILPTLRAEIMNRYKGERGRVEESLKDDAQVIAASGLIGNKKEYARRLGLK